ncbi:MAG: hypothetical protein H7Z41_10945 [Cytophagales bacterium]|nr:hypothetical protein [Armatimonadota bacterium]
MSYYQQPNPYTPQQAEQFQQRQDEDNLRLLSIFHYVLGGVTILGASIFLIHFGMGLAMLLNPGWMKESNGDAPPAFMGWLFTLMGGGAVAVGWALGGLTIHAGRCLARRTGYTLALVMACLNCLHAPMGTALGIFTILVLNRPSVKAMFGLPVQTMPYPSSADLGTPSMHPWYRGQ